MAEPDSIPDEPESIDAGYKPPPSMARSATDWANSFIRGLAKGTEGMVGLPGDAANALSQVSKVGSDYVADKVGIDKGPEPSKFNLLPTSEGINKAVGGDEMRRNTVGKFLDKKPETPGGKYAESIGEFVPGMVGGPGGVVRKGIQAVVGGAGSEAAGQVAKEYAPDHETAARVLGGITGQSIPGMVSRAISPLPITAERRAHVENLRHEGIEPTAGDLSGRKTLKYAEHALGDTVGAGGAYTEARERIDGQVARAALRRIGENAEAATPEVIDRAGQRIGRTFDDLSARNAAHLDPQFGTDIFQAQHDYDHLFVDPLRRPIVERVIENATNLMARGATIPGEVYQAQRSMLERMRRGYRADPELNGFLSEVRDALDGVMERSIRQHNPDDLGAWREVRNQYRNLLTLERVASGAGPAAADGAVSPARLRQAALAQGGRRSYARGQGDFGELARSGNVVLGQPPTSGTAERTQLLHTIPAAIGGAGGALMEGAPGAAIGSMAGIAAPAIAGRALMSAPAQAYLKNQLAANLGISPTNLDKIVREALAEHGRQATDLPPITVEGE